MYITSRVVVVFFGVFFFFATLQKWDIVLNNVEMVYVYNSGIVDNVV